MMIQWLRSLIRKINTLFIDVLMRFGLSSLITAIKPHFLTQL